jgi:hypothetical protein
MATTRLSTALAALALMYAAASPAQVVINEVDYDQVGADTAEYLELYNAGPAAVNLDNYTVELVNGSGGGAAVYDTIDLPNVSLAAGDYYVICANAATVPNCDLDDGPNTDFIQNGAPDGIGLRLSGVLVDAVSYEGNTGAPYTEGTGTAAADSNTIGLIGISRLPDGTDSNNNNADFSLRCISPGFANVSGTTGCLDPAAAPTISADDIFDFEGTGGTTTFSVEVVLGAPAPTGGIAVPYATADGTATVADGDYVAASGTLSIAAGASSGFIDLTVNADSTPEGDEEFYLDLGPASAGILGTRRVTVFVDNDDTATVSIANASVVEGDMGNTPMVFTATLSAPIASDCEFGVEIFGVPPGTPATPDVDFVNATAQVTIPAMQTQATFEVQIIGDTLPEDDEQFVVETFGEPFVCDIFSASAIGTILDDDAPITVSIDDVTLAEGNAGPTPFQFTLSLSAPAPAPLQYRVYTQDGTATAPDDYTAISPGTPLFVNFAVGETQQPVTIQVNGDTTLEADESFSVVVAAGGAVAPEGLPPTLATGIGTILNDDVPTLTIAGTSVIEGTGAGSTVAEFTVTLSAQPAPASPVTVNYATASGSALSGTDFTATSGTLTFVNGGALTQTIVVPITRDAIDESDEDFTVTLLAPVNATLGSPSTATGTIEDDDTATPSVNSISLAEGNSGTTAFTFTVSLSTQASTTRNYIAYTADGTAVAPGDYTAISAATPVGVVFAAGDVEETVTVLVNGDSTVEPDEGFQLLLAFPGNGAPEGGGPPVLASGTGTILNDDVERLLTIGDVSVVEGTGAGSTVANVVVTLSAEPAAGNPVTVNYTTASGSATSGTDFTATSGTLTFVNGAALTQTIAVPVTRDAIDESDEDFSLTLSTPVNATLGVPSTATGTILDDDTATPSVNSISLAEGNSGTTAFTFTVSLSTPASTTRNYIAYTADGSAIAPADYTAISAATPVGVVFAAGDVEETVTVLVNGDSTVEPDDSFQLLLAFPGNGAPEGNGPPVLATGTGTIQNDDTATLSISGGSVSEGNAGNTPLSFTLTLSNPVDGAVSVTFATADGTATVADNDYQAASGTVNFPSQSTTQTISVNVIGDLEVEPDQGFTVNLSNLVAPAGVSLGTASATGTILNDDATSFTISGGSVVEGTGGNTTLVYTVTSSAPAKDPVSVQYATGGGTATAGSDYTAASGTVVFSGGQTSQSINVTVIGDNLVEPDETVIVTLSNPNGGTITTATATGTIVNDDFASLSIADIALPEGNPGGAAAPEGAGGLTPFVFTVSSSNPSATPITVNFQTADGTALAPADYIAGTGPVTIPAGATTGTLTVQVVPDTMIEANETFFVNLSGASGATIADAQAIGTIIGDDLLAPIPTLGEHGRWLLALLLASLGAFVLARRR